MPSIPTRLVSSSPTPGAARHSPDRDPLLPTCRSPALLPDVAALPPLLPPSWKACRRSPSPPPLRLPLVMPRQVTTACLPLHHIRPPLAPPPLPLRLPAARSSSRPDLVLSLPARSRPEPLRLRAASLGTSPPCCHDARANGRDRIHLRCHRCTSPSSPAATPVLPREGCMPGAAPPLLPPSRSERPRGLDLAGASKPTSLLSLLLSNIRNPDKISDIWVHSKTTNKTILTDSMSKD